jgi:hypothetical protein
MFRDRHATFEDEALGTPADAAPKRGDEAVLRIAWR